MRLFIVTLALVLGLSSGSAVALSPEVEERVRQRFCEMVWEDILRAMVRATDARAGFKSLLKKGSPRSNVPLQASKQITLEAEPLINIYRSLECKK
jgi:hypothetical protein